MTRDVSTRVRGDVDRGSASTSVGEPTRRREADIHRIPFPAGFFGEGTIKNRLEGARERCAARRGGRQSVAGQSSRVLTFRLGREFLVSRRDDRRDGGERRLRPSVTGFGSRVRFILPRDKWTGNLVARVVERPPRRKLTRLVSTPTRLEIVPRVWRIHARRVRPPPRQASRANRICLVNSPPSAPASVSPAAFGADIFSPANIIFFHDCLPIRPLFRVEEICAPSAHWTRQRIPSAEGRGDKKPAGWPVPAVCAAAALAHGGRAGVKRLSPGGVGRGVPRRAGHRVAVGRPVA